MDRSKTGSPSSPFNWENIPAPSPVVMGGTGWFPPYSCPSAGHAIYESRRLPDIAQRVEQPIQFIVTKFRSNGAIFAQDLPQVPPLGHCLLCRVLDQFVGMEPAKLSTQRHHHPL